ncbi:MAG: hypothetical protein ACRC5M_00455 [Anaeroplasmataceae bacterium]
MQNKGNIPVFKKSTFLALTKKGLMPVDESINYKKDGYVVWYFEDTTEVRDAIKEVSMEIGRSVFKLKNFKVAMGLMAKGYEVLNIKKTEADGKQYVFKWEETIYEDMLAIREEIFGADCIVHE